MSERGIMTLTEYNDMPPWHVDVHLSLLREKVEKAKQAAQSNKGVGL